MTYCAPVQWATGSLLETCHKSRGAGGWRYGFKGNPMPFHLFVYISSLFQPVVTSQLGTINNLIHVKKSDFEVFDALKLDSMESSETSCRGNIVLLLSLAVSSLQCILLPFPNCFALFYIFMFSQESYNLTHISHGYNVCLSFSDTLFSILPNTSSLRFQMLFPVRFTLYVSIWWHYLWRLGMSCLSC